MRRDEGVLRLAHNLREDLADDLRGDVCVGLTA